MAANLCPAGSARYLALPTNRLWPEDGDEEAGLPRSISVSARVLKFPTAVGDGRATPQETCTMQDVRGEMRSLSERLSDLLVRL
jgi:hypothetical protein